MVTVASKLLLLVALLVRGGESAVSRGDYKRRGLSFDQPFVSYEEESSNGSKSGKSGKSGTGKSGKKSSKGKSDIGKGAKALHVDSSLTVEYTVVEHFEGKSSKGEPLNFEYSETGYKSSKDEDEYGSGGGTSVKNNKSSGGGGGKYDKPSGGGGGKYTKQNDGSDGKYSKSSGGSDGKYTKPIDGTIKDSKSSKGAPTLAPLGTSPPTEDGTFGVGVPIYSLVYKLTSSNEPTTEDLIVLKEATGSYLGGYFADEFDGDDFTIYSQFINDIDGFTENTDTQVVVSYDSIVRFGQLSLIKPMPVQLGSSIEEAFTGVRMIQYEDYLKETLPEDNIFVGAKVQYYHGDGVSDKPSLGWLIGASASMTVLLAGLVLYNSKKDDRESDIDKLNKSPGDMTVAGETFAGETYDGTGSVSAASAGYIARINDEEEGTERNDGSREGYDSDSVKAPWNNANETDDRRGIFRLAPRKMLSVFKSSAKSAPRTSSFEDVALQAPAYGDRLQQNVMPDPSNSEDDDSQMSDSELSQFVANQTSGGHTLEIKSILSQDSIDENTTGDLSVRDNSSRRLRTVAEIEALLSSELKDENSNSGSRSSRSIVSNRPRTVEEIESLLTADDDDSIVELSISDESGTNDEC